MFQEHAEQAAGLPDQKAQVKASTRAMKVKTVAMGKE
jgi:hypothetical protein